MPNPEDRGENPNNIGQQHADRVVNPLAKYEQNGTIDTAKYNQDDHANYARQREAEAGQGSPSGGWADRTSGGAGAEPQGFAGKAKAAFMAMSGRKKGAMGGIIVLILGLLGVGGTLFTPGIGIVQMKEVLTSNLNDQLAAMDIRSDSVFRAKLKSMSSGVCTGVQIKCKFSTMSNRQVNKFKAAFEKYGYIIPDDGIQETALGRKRITKIVAPDGSVIKNPADLIQARKSNADVRAAMKRVFNPVYYGLSDKVANTFLRENNTDKKKKITGTDEEEMRKQMAEATSGERAGASRGVVLTDAEGEEYVVDPEVEDDNGKPRKVYANDPDFEAVKNAAEQRISELEAKSNPGLKATGGLFRAAGAGVSALGVADAACSVYNLSRAVAATAKAARSMQLVQYAMVINSAADSIKAGDATPEEVEFVGNMLTKTDTNKTTLNETTGEQEENPFYGKAAFDSPGYKTASYNDAPILTPQSQQYMVGGGLSGSLSSVMSDVEKALTADNPAALRSTCGVIQSPWVRGAGLVAGVFLAIGSFGVGTAISIAASAAVGFAIPFLEAALSDIVAGNVIGEDIAGVDAGDAFFAGTSALLGGIAMKRGMAPLGKSGIQQYLAATADTRETLIADAKAEASQDQFNPYNQYSFLGSLTQTLFPVVSQAQSSASGALMSVGSLISTSVGSLTRDASATQEYNEARYSLCNDQGYEELGIDADVFCNVRYGLTPQELGMDSEAVVDFMLAKEFISGSGTPQGKYEEFMKNCVNREDGWGETSEENGNIGLECVDGSGSTYEYISYFRVYTMDASLSDAMDDEDEATTSQIAGSTIDLENLYKDSTDVACAPNTQDKGISTGYVDGADFPVRICALPNTQESGKPDGMAIVNSRVSGAAYAMIEQMKKDLGVQKITFNDSFRSPEKQQEAINRCGLYSQGGCAAAQGFSNHQSGVALDFGEGGCAYTAGIKECPASKYWVWLKENASKFGFRNEIAEWWHWSPTGG